MCRHCRTESAGNITRVDDLTGTCARYEIEPTLLETRNEKTRSRAYATLQIARIVHHRD